MFRNFLCVSMQQDFDQNKLEEEMRKRKERVEKWREEQRKKAIENIGEIKKELEEMKQGKKWSLEDDEGEQTPLRMTAQELFKKSIVIRLQKDIYLFIILQT